MSDTERITELEAQLAKERALREKAETEVKRLRPILDERARQDVKWGEQNHTQYKWLAIITEELGEAAQASLEDKPVSYHDELVQVAACAIAAIESLKRQAGKT